MSEALALDPEGFERRIAQYQEWLRVNHFSETTAESHGRFLQFLVAWCAERGITRPSEVTKQVLERYQAHLYHYRKTTGDPLALKTQQNYLTSAKGLFRWLARENYILYNPASEIRLPTTGRRLPKFVLTPEEAERVLAVPDVATSLGIRDRSILETLYSSGLRRMELIALRLYDVDRERRTLTIREGKGRRQRVVPIGERALSWVEKYVDEVRPMLVVPPDEGFIFLTHLGGPWDADALTEHVRKIVKRSDIGKAGAVHLWRHTMATVMLEGGADIRYVQAMLGHRQLETTAIYTHVAIGKLREVHRASHPAEQKRTRQDRPAPAAPAQPEAAPPVRDDTTPPADAARAP